jgi:putative ABC transport system permease protein
MVVGLLAGSYPAIVMSRFQPVSAIKGEVRIGGRSHLTRSLIVLQYTASITLMICTGVMLQQQSYVQNKDLGFNKDQIVLIHGGSWEIAGRFKQEVLKDSRVAGVTLSDYGFVYNFCGNDYKLPNGEALPGGKDWIIPLGVDVDYLSTFEIPLLQDRNFSIDHPSDRKHAVLINETLAKLLNLGNPVGKTLDALRYE